MICRNELLAVLVIGRSIGHLRLGHGRPDRESDVSSKRWRRYRRCRELGSHKEQQHRECERNTSTRESRSPHGWLDIREKAYLRSPISESKMEEDGGNG